MALNTYVKVKVGCCGFAGSMKDYFRKFKIVEVQQTFYRLPKEKTPIVYLRLHGLRKEINHAYKFTKQDLKQLESRILELRQEKSGLRAL